MEFFNRFIDTSLLQRLQLVLDAKFEHVSYSRAIELLQKAELTFNFPVKWGSDLQTEHERYLTEKVFKKPVFVTDYPKEIKAFYMRLNDDDRTVAAMDLLVPDVGEIIGGSQREERHDVLQKPDHRNGPENRGLRVVPEPAQIRRRPARRLRPGLRKGGHVPDRHGKHPRRHPLPAHAQERGILVT